MFLFMQSPTKTSKWSTGLQVGDDGCSCSSSCRHLHPHFYESDDLLDVSYPFIYVVVPLHEVAHLAAWNNVAQGVAPSTVDSI